MTFILHTCEKNSLGFSFKLFSIQTRRECLALCHWVNNWQVVRKTHFLILRPVWFFFPPSIPALFSLLPFILPFFPSILTLNAFMWAVHHKHEAFSNLPPTFQLKVFSPKESKEMSSGKREGLFMVFRMWDSRGYTFQVSVERLKNSRWWCMHLSTLPPEDKRSVPHGDSKTLLGQAGF